jgi:hypothetical protein
MERSSPSGGADRHPLPPTTDLEAFRRADHRVGDLVADDPAFAPYLRARTDAAVAGLASIVSGMSGFAPGSPGEDLVREVVEHWAVGMGLFDGPPSRRDEFLETFDLEFPRRRLGLVIERLDAEGAAADGRSSPPLRPDIDAAARDLEDLRTDIGSALTTMVAGEDAPASAVRARRAVRTAFPAEGMDDLLRADGDRRAAAAMHLHSAREPLGTAVDAIGLHLREALPDPPGQGFDTLAQATRGWDESLRTDLLVAYTGFAFWDDPTGGGDGPAETDSPRTEDVVELERRDLVLLLLADEDGHPVSEAVLEMPDGEDREHITRARPLP